MFGIDEFYDGLLLEAKSPEEIKRIYGYQFVEGKGVPQEILDQVFELDPTKKKTFTKWLLLKWPDESNLIRSSLSNGKIGEIFRYFQERARDGLNLADVKSVSDALRMLPNNYHIFASIPDDEKDNPENQFKIVYDSPEWRVVRPFTYEADAKLGAGSMWCTAGAYGNGERYWEDYSDDGPIWVNFDMRVSEIAPRGKKEYPYKRYQFCFEANDFKGELTDINDSRIDFEKIDMPQEVIEFYGKINRKYQDCIESNGDNAKIIERYNDALKDCNVQVLNHYGEDHSSSGHLYLVRLLGKDCECRNNVIEKMAERGIACNVHYKPLPMMTAYKALGFDINDYPNAYNQYRNEVTLPLHTCLSDEDVEYVITNFEEIIMTF